MDFYGLGKSNKYFVNALQVLWPDVEKALKKYSNYKVTFTGHSLGGAMASLAALKTVHKKLRDKNDVILYTFGQPRVGNVVLARNHDKLVPKSFRIVHSIDIVPHLPGCEKKEIMGASSHPCNPEHLENPYHHGIEIYYPHEMHESNSTYFECLGEPKGEDYKCSDALTFKPEHHYQYIYAHTHYFEHKVSALGKLGCVGTKEEEDDLPADYGKEKKEPFRNLVKAVQFAATLFG
uniref:Fungal lipase-like domain-containing protein n=1 Tax=Panagrolaimus davidi TaxID=227884 RepID=A0A914QV70_9BILA